MIEWLRRRLAKWLGVTGGPDAHTLRLLERSKELVNKSLVLRNKSEKLLQDFDVKLACLQALIDQKTEYTALAADVGFHDKSEIMVIHYSALTNSLKVLAQGDCKFETYNRLVRHLRNVCRDFNADVAILNDRRGSLGMEVEQIRHRVSD
jgi:hypothetical protein